MTDSFGNYVPGLTSLAPTSASTDGPVRRQHGAPDANTPLYPMFVIDEDTGTVYFNVDGTTSGWAVFVGGGGGGGTGNVISSSVDPTGVLTVTGAGLCFGTGAVHDQWWKKTSSGTGSDWQLM